MRWGRFLTKKLTGPVNSCPVGLKESKNKKAQNQKPGTTKLFRCLAEGKMFSFLRKKGKPPIEILFFKSNEAAFEHACKFMDCSITVGGYLPALVHEVHEGEDRTRMILKLPNAEGGQYVASSLLNNELKDIKPGDLVVYQLAERLPNAPDVLSMIGFVVAKLKPQLDVNQGWVIEG